MFYDLNEKKIKSTLFNINTYTSCRLNFIIIRKDLLLIPGENKIYIIDINEYKLIRNIDIPNSGSIYGFCLLNKNILLTGDQSKSIKQWRIEGDNLILTSTKEKAHNDCINVLLKIGDGHIVSASDDNIIKIW